MVRTNNPLVTDRMIADLLAERMKLEVPGLHTDLIGQGILDSLALVELVLQIEQTFSVAITLDELDLDALRTTSTIADFVNELQHAAVSA